MSDPFAQLAQQVSAAKVAKAAPASVAASPDQFADLATQVAAAKKAPAFKESPLTASNATEGAGELAATGIGNIFPGIGNAAVDLYRFTRGEPQQQTFGYFHPGEAGKNVLTHLGQLPTGLHDAQNGQPINVQTALSRLTSHNPFLAPQTIQNRPLLTRFIQGTERVGSDLSTVLPAADVAANVGKGALHALTDEASSVPTKEELAAQAGAAYKRAENAGVVVKPEPFQALQQQLTDELTKEGFNPELHPDTAAALKSLSAAEGPQSLQQLEIQRRIAQAAEGAQRPADQRLAAHIVDSLDNFVENLSPQDVAAGNGREGAQALLEARNLWSRKRKADVIDELMRRASIRAPNFSGSGMENSVRTEFRQLAMNPKRLRMFTPEEQAAITRVAKGGTVDNALRMLGKFAPTGAVSAAISGGAGLLAGGPLGAVAVPAGGWLAREAATRLTLRNALRAGELVRRGPPLRILPEVAEEAAAAPKPVLPLPAPAMVGGTFGIARDEQLAHLGLTPDIRAAAGAHPGLARPGVLPPPLALPAPGQVAIPLSNDAVAAAERNRALGLTPGTMQAAGAHPGFPRLSANPVEPEPGLLASMEQPSNVVQMPKRVKVRGVKSKPPSETPFSVAVIGTHAGRKFIITKDMEPFVPEGGRKPEWFNSEREARNAIRRLAQ